MRVLITGGAGFIGSHLGRHLHDRGDEVLLLDDLSYGHVDNLLVDGRTFARLICEDVRTADLRTHFDGVDTVVHFAGIAPLPVCQADPGKAYAINTAAVASVLEAARLAGVRRVIFSSTSAVYENNHSALFSEDEVVRPDLTYASTKFAAEQICRNYARLYGMDVVICRFFNVYGAHQDVLRTSPPFTSYVARELVLGRAPRLFNNSGARRDYVFVDDVVDLLTRMIDAEDRSAGECFNVASGNGVSVPELYALFCAVSGRSVEAVYGDPQDYWNAYPQLFASTHPLDRERIVKEVHKQAIGNPEKARARYGWTARTSLRDGVAAVVADARARFA